jgi:RNA polymerase sigma factor (TIGR02999 family)
VDKKIPSLIPTRQDGDASTESELFAVVYDQLKGLASRYLRSERDGHTLQTTALVHEAWLHVNSEGANRGLERSHFIAIAARAMKNILIDHARAHGSIKRGGKFHKVDLNTDLLYSLEKSAEFLALTEAIDRLALLDPRQARLVDMKYFGGMTFAEIAAEFGCSERTVKREWELARAWLYEQLSSDAHP